MTKNVTEKAPFFTQLIPCVEKGTACTKVSRVMM